MKATKQRHLVDQKHEVHAHTYTHAVIIHVCLTRTPILLYGIAQILETSSLIYGYLKKACMLPLDEFAD